MGYLPAKAAVYITMFCIRLFVCMNCILFGTYKYIIYLIELEISFYVCYVIAQP